MADTATAANGTVLPPPEEIANAIVEIAEGMKALNKTRLTRRAITLLIHDRSKVARRDIDLVLNNLEELEDFWLKPIL